MNTQGNKFCDVAGHRITYQRWGFGEPILLVHGITTYSFIWRNLMPALSSQYDAIAIDLLGCGDSDKPLNESYSIKRHAELMYEFIEQLEIKRFHFIGHDIGGGIGQVFAVNHPDNLYDLTLINTVAYDLWPVQPIAAMRTPIIRQIIMAALNRSTYKQLIQRGLYFKERVNAELIDHFLKPMQTSEGRKAFLHFANCLDNQHLMAIEKDLRKLDLPVLIIRGDADVYLSASISERLHREISDSRLEHITTGGHFIQEDEPEKITKLITQFFRERTYDIQ